MRYEAIHAVTVICLLMMSTTIAISGPSHAEANNEQPTAGRLMMDHPPIVISSDSDFASQASSESWAGSGTEGDPYIIQGYSINASSTNYGIHISGTTVFFIVRGCSIFDAALDLPSPFPYGMGIRLYKVKNGLLQYCQLLRNPTFGLRVQECSNITVDNLTVKGSPTDTGIAVELSRDVSIQRCIIEDAGDGIRIESSMVQVKGLSIRDMTYNGIEVSYSGGSVFEDNLIVDAGKMGIYIRSGCSYNEFISNTLINCSFALYGEKEVFTTNRIPTENTVNGLPVLQVRDKVALGELGPLSAGQLILGNVSDALITGMNISRASEAVILGYCSRVEVTGCNLSHNSRGVEVVGGDNITMDECIFIGCDDTAIVMVETIDPSITRCSFKGSEYGVVAWEAMSRACIKDNAIVGCGYGIALFGATGALVEQNLIQDAGTYGIYLEEVFDSTISGNRMVTMLDPRPTDKGIVIYLTESLLIKDNLIIGAKLGIHQQEALATKLVNNTLDSCLEQGALFDASKDCLVQGNLFYGSGGLALSFLSDNGPTRNNLIWGNSFLYNNGATMSYQPGRYQAHDAEPTNNWTSPVDGKGNHWSDWTSPDPDMDGIVDLPYALEGGNADKKPLVLDPILYVTPPTDVRATASKDSVNITWGEPTFTRSGQISGYRVFRTGGDGDLELLMELPSTARSYLDLEVESGRPYDYSVLAYNRYGSGLMSPSVGATPDNSSPRLVVTTPGNGSYWNVTSLLASWESGDNVGVAGHRLRLDLNDWTDIGNATTFLLTDLSEGDHVLEVECWDALNNTAVGKVSFHIDLTAPEVDILRPIEGLITSSTSLTLEWVAEDLPYSMVTHSWRLDGGAWTPANGTSILFEGLANGHHNAYVRAIDMAGNVGSGYVNFTIDTLSPTVDIKDPTEGEEFSMRPILAAWEYNGTGSRVTGVRTKIDSGPWRELGLASNETLVGLETGNHTYWVSVTDEAGNTGTDHVSFRVLQGIPEPPGPGKGLVMGRVLDKDGMPVHKVKVKSDTGEQTYTDSEGYFYLEVPSGRRTLTFSKKGFATYERTIVVLDNSTFDLGNVTVVKRMVERGAGWKVWQYCLFCCLIPMVLVILIFIVIGAIARIRRSSRRRLDEE